MSCRCLSKAVGVVLIAVLCLPGCSSSKPASTLRLRGANMISWRIRDAATPVPGLTEARVWKIATEDGKHVVILWGDFEQTMNTKDTIVGGSGQFEMETVVAQDGRRIAWQCDVKGNSLSVTINKQTFDLSKGSLILISTGSPARSTASAKAAGASAARASRARNNARI